MKCPICAGKANRLFQKHGYWIRECENCRHQFAEITPSAEHTERIYGDHYFREGGDGYPDYLTEAKLLTAHGRRYGYLVQKYLAPGKVLDVGTAAGFVLDGLCQSGWRGIGLEPNATMANYARHQLGLNVKTGSLEQFKSSDQFDLISMIQVAAHFYDLRQAFQVAAKLTRPGGFWLIETWDKESWTARILGQSWHEYSPPSVLQWFSPATLQHLVSQFGFCEITRGKPIKKINAAHAKSLLRYKLEDMSLGRLAVIFLKFIPDQLTIPYPAEDIFWALYKKAK